jgi:peroxiredoxin
MKTRWSVAAAGALALAMLTLGAPLPANPFAAVVADAAAGVCEAKPKPANLNFTLKDANGKSVKLSAFKGKVIILDFWATWCGPCKIEIPGFVELQNKYGQDGLQVIGVSVDDPPEKLKPYIAQFKMNYPVLQGLGHDDMLDDAFGPMLGIPTTFIIGRDGNICRKHTGMASKEQFEAAVKALVARQPSHGNVL